jgi:hypothetical protein
MRRSRYFHCHLNDLVGLIPPSSKAQKIHASIKSHLTSESTKPTARTSISATFIAVIPSRRVREALASEATTNRTESGWMEQTSSKTVQSAHLMRLSGHGILLNSPRWNWPHSKYGVSSHIMVICGITCAPKMTSKNSNHQSIFTEVRPPEATLERKKKPNVFFFKYNLD